MDFSQIIALVESSKYILVFFGSFFEGTVVMMTSGVFWRLGGLEFWPMYIALVAGDFIADIVWYAVGYFGARPFVTRWGHLFGATPEVVDKVTERFRKHQVTILIVSKLTTGFGFALATLITAGMLHVPIRLYMAVQFFGGLVWVFMVVMVGYYFGDLFANAPQALQIVLSATLLLAAFFGLRLLSARLAKSNW